MRRHVERCPVLVAYRDHRTQQVTRHDVALIARSVAVVT